MSEYYITRLASEYFKVAKFEGDAQPSNIYFVTMKVPKQKGYRNIQGKSLPEMHCDCPNRRRDAHINDKHGRMVAQWLIAGERPGFFDEKGAFHATDTIIPADADDHEPGADLGDSDTEGDAD